MINIFYTLDVYQEQTGLAFSARFEQAEEALKAAGFLNQKLIADVMIIKHVEFEGYKEVEQTVTYNREQIKSRIAGVVEESLPS